VDEPVRFQRRIFISRRKTGTRTLANEGQLEKLLHAKGFETHFMEQYSLATQARLIREAEVIVATHGAGLANLMFARPRTHVIEIVPAGRYNATCYPEKSRVFGLHHQLVFAERARFKQILRVSLGDIETALDQTQRQEYRLAQA
jgi:capsular polysaccharide biosynthesis protein